MGVVQMGNCVVGGAPKNPPFALCFMRTGLIKIAYDNQPSPTIPSTLTKLPPLSQLQPLTTSVQSSHHSALH